jgi:Contractile injection system tube protein/LysM domain
MSASSLEKLKITPMLLKEKRLERQKPIPVLFNPESYSISKRVNWHTPNTNRDREQKETTSSQFNAPIVKFGGGESRELTLKLFFDATVSFTQNGKPVQDVREISNKIVTLTQIQRDRGQPPICEISWGKAPVNSDFPFIGVVTSLTQEFTQFSRDGKPVRATLNVTFREFFDPELDLRKTDPELTTQIVRSGMTLSSMTADLHHNPKLWRIIAEANEIDDPRHLEVGQTLIIPSLNV